MERQDIRISHTCSDQNTVNIFLLQQPNVFLYAFIFVICAAHNNTIPLGVCQILYGSSYLGKKGIRDIWDKKTNGIGLLPH
ncbi:hypothetical protein D3C76_952430 [compost metagenome]